MLGRIARGHDHVLEDAHERAQVDVIVDKPVVVAALVNGNDILDVILPVASQAQEATSLAQPVFFSNLNR